MSVGTATVAMILNGLGFSNRRLYLVPQFFATKAVERLLGPGITAEQLNDDCLGRTLDWLYAQDPTTLFAGIARQARQRFGVAARQIHVDTTSFSVSGEYAAGGGRRTTEEHLIAVTYGYSRDHRADLKQWMLALATTRQGDVPLYLKALDGNASDKVSLVAAVEALAAQLRSEPEKTPLFVADSGLYSAENVARLSGRGGALDQSGARDRADCAAGRARRGARRAGSRRGTVVGAGGARRRRASVGWWCARPRAATRAGHAGAQGRAGAWGVGEGAVAPERAALRL